MNRSTTLSLAFLIGTSLADAQAPQGSRVEPSTGKIGSTLSLTGQGLGKAKVDEVYLSDQSLDLKVKVLDQTDSKIVFRIPPSVKPGRLQVLLKTTGKEPKLLEQPVYVTVEENTNVLAASH